MDIKRLKKKLTDNLAIKLFALLFAIVLWVHASTRGQSEVNFVIPLELRNIPSELAVIGDVPGFVDVRVRGEDSKLRVLSSDDVKVGLDLSDAEEGEVRYTITDNNIAVPTGLDVVKISPVAVRLVFDTKVKKQLVVKPILIGEPASGYEVAEVSVIPHEVGATGPKSELKGMESVSTEPISIQGLKGGLENRVALQKPASGYVRLDDNHVIVMITVNGKKDSD